MNQRLRSFQSRRLQITLEDLTGELSEKLDSIELYLRARALLEMDQGDYADYPRPVKQMEGKKVKWDIHSFRELIGYIIP